MNKPTYIIIHCSATREDKDFTEKQINDSHVARGFGKWGIPLLYPERRSRDSHACGKRNRGT